MDLQWIYDGLTKDVGWIDQGFAMYLLRVCYVNP